VSDTIWPQVLSSAGDITDQGSSAKTIKTLRIVPSLLLLIDVLLHVNPPIDARWCIAPFQCIAVYSRPKKRQLRTEPLQSRLKKNDAK